MPAFNTSISSILQLISFISPVLLGFFMFMISIFNQNVKGFIYIAGVLGALSINNILNNTIGGNEQMEDQSAICNYLSGGVGTNRNPAPNSVVLAFTTVYLLVPMIMNKQTNVSMIAILFLLLGIDGWTQIKNRCSDGAGVFMGVLVGTILGIVWFFLLDSTGNSNLLYFDEVRSTREQCSRPSQERFKCSVYKNGQLISSDIS